MYSLEHEMAPWEAYPDRAEPEAVFYCRLPFILPGAGLYKGAGKVAECFHTLWIKINGCKLVNLFEKTK